MIRKLAVSALLVLGTLGGVATSQAAVVFEFGTIVTGAPVGGPLYARLTITNAGANTVSLFLENTATMPAATGQSIHRVHLNIDPFISNFNLTSADPHFEGFNLSQDGQHDAGSSFDLQINLDIAPPADRFTPGDSMTMTATGTGLTETNFLPLSAGNNPRQAMVHLISIPTDGSSAKVTTPVPEPASFAALGLGALALFRRRRQK